MRNDSTAKTVQEMYEEFSYSDELKFVFWDEYLNVGKNKLNYVYEGAAVDVELIEVPTIGLGLCHVIQLKNVSNWIFDKRCLFCLNGL